MAETAKRRPFPPVLLDSWCKGSPERFDRIIDDSVVRTILTVHPMLQNRVRFSTFRIFFGDLGNSEEILFFFEESAARLHAASVLKEP